MPANYLFVDIENEDSDIWKDNPDLQFSEPFAKFKKSERNSNKIMKAIYLIYDPKSRFNIAKEPQEKIIEDVTKNFLRKREFDWTKYNDVIEAYKENCKSPLQRQYEEILSDYEGFISYYRNLSWEDEDEARIKTGHMKTIEDYGKKIIELKKLVDGEENEQKYKFDYRKSMIENLAGKNARD